LFPSRSLKSTGIPDFPTSGQVNPILGITQFKAAEFRRFPKRTMPQSGTELADLAEDWPFQKGILVKKKDLLTIRDLDKEELCGLLHQAVDIKHHPERYTSILKGKALALIFEKPSLRTRLSFDVGIHQLGGFSVSLGQSEINLGKRESIHDVAKNLERMVQGVMIRTFAHSIVEEMGAAVSIPVINGLTDYSHPCQALADYFTIKEFKGRLPGLRLCYVGDGNNVARSLMFAGALLGVHVTVACPPGYEPDEATVRLAREDSKSTGSEITVSHDPREAVAGADVVYTDVWASMGQESEQEQRRKVFRDFQVNSQLMQKAGRGAIFMHCLPAHRGDEVTDEVMDSPASVVFQQAENRLHAQKALLVELMRSR
jgi:ornithine carbamoyltransferase